jgi:hypothetical protein
MMMSVCKGIPAYQISRSGTKLSYQQAAGETSKARLQTQRRQYAVSDKD